MLFFLILWTGSRYLVNSGADITISQHFHTTEAGWVYKYGQPWAFLYAVGPIPGILLALSALIAFFVGFFKPNFRLYQKHMLLILLTSIIGAGVLVSGVLKPYCGRPRPREIQQFGGQQAYCSPCERRIPGEGMSFPCGHCTMGYLFVSLFFLRKKQPRIAYIGGSFGLFSGTLMGVGRIVQGGHFASDVLWSLGIVVIVATNIYYLVLPIFESIQEALKHASRKRRLIWGLSLAASTILILALLINLLPYFNMPTRAIPVRVEIPAITP